MCSKEESKGVKNERVEVVNKRKTRRTIPTTTNVSYFAVLEAQQKAHCASKLLSPSKTCPFPRLRKIQTCVLCWRNSWKFMDDPMLNVSVGTCTWSAHSRWRCLATEPASTPLEPIPACHCQGPSLAWCLQGRAEIKRGQQCCFFLGSSLMFRFAEANEPTSLIWKCMHLADRSELEATRKHTYTNYLT